MMHSETGSLLEDLVVAPMALAPASPPGAHSVDASWRITTESSKSLKASAPWFVRDLAPTKVAGRWQALCGLLRKQGVPLFATTQELQTVPAGDVPARIAQRRLDQPLLRAELLSADAIELNSVDASGIWAWPYEIDGPRDLKLLVNVIREAAGADVPIGISLPLGAKLADLRACMESTCDFLTLVHCAASLQKSPRQLANYAALNIVAARKYCVQSGKPRWPILLDAPLHNVDQMLKLLLLGASAINIASLVEHVLTEEPKTVSESSLTANLLGNLPSSSKQFKELPDIERAIQKMKHGLVNMMQFAGAPTLAELDSNSLRSLSSTTATMLGVAPA